MFLTCVAARRNSRPSPSLVSSQSRPCHVAHVRFMFTADASSTGHPYSECDSNSHSYSDPNAYPDP